MIGAGLKKYSETNPFTHNIVRYANFRFTFGFNNRKNNTAINSINQASKCLFEITEAIGMEYKYSVKDSPQ